LKDTIVRLWIGRSHLAMLVAMVESYEALGVIRVLDSKKALAEVHASPHFLDDLLALIQDLSQEGIAVKVLEIHS